MLSAAGCISEVHTISYNFLTILGEIYMQLLIPRKSILLLRNAFYFFLIFFFFCSISSSEDKVILIENKVVIGEPIGGKWHVTINTDSVSAYRDSCLKNELGIVYATDDIEVFGAVLMLYNFGRVKIKKPPTQYLYFYLFNEKEELVDALEYYHQKFERSDGKTMELMEKLDANARDSLKVGNEALIYRYLGEGYYLIKLGKHFATLDQNCFDFLEKPRYLWTKMVKTERVEGWIDATKLTAYPVLDEN